MDAADILWPHDHVAAGKRRAVAGRLLFVHLNGLDLPAFRGRAYVELVVPMGLGSAFNRVVCSLYQLGLPGVGESQVRRAASRMPGEGVLFVTASELERARDAGRMPLVPYLICTAEPWVSVLPGVVQPAQRPRSGASAGRLGGHHVVVVDRDYRPGPACSLASRPSIIGSVVDADLGAG